MTKLEQCVRLVTALNEENGEVTISFARGKFIVRSSSDQQLTESTGATLDEAVDDMHASLMKETKRLREALTLFEDKQ